MTSQISFCNYETKYSKGNFGTEIVHIFLEVTHTSAASFKYGIKW